MSNTLPNIITKIESINPLHSKKLKINLQNANELYQKRAEEFLKLYQDYLAGMNKDIDYGIQCYLKMVADFTYSHIRFIRTGEYESKSFQEVNKRVYENPAVMEYYMIGLLLSQFLWKHHYDMFDFFSSNFKKYSAGLRQYLEVGGGHGLFISDAIRQSAPDVKFKVVDISQHSIDLAKKFIGNKGVEFIVSDIQEYDNNQKFDFITMGEVLEHVEKPKELLVKLSEFLTDTGVMYITVPANAPAIDHIYLFRNEQEIDALISESGFDVLEKRISFAEDVSKEKAEKHKVTMMYGAFLKKRKQA